MKTNFLKAVLVLFFAAVQFQCFAGFREEILKLTRIDLLPKYQEDVITRQVSSYDTTGGNDDGFSGRYSVLRKENGVSVIADLKGPGVIQRIWTPTPSFDTIQFFFDGEAVPRISLPFIDLFSGERDPFLRPVVGNEVGGYYCYLPIPYQKSCKIVYKGKQMQFFQIQYRELKGKNTVESFPKKLSDDEHQALLSVVAFWKKNEANFAGLAKTQRTSVQQVVLNPGETKTVFEVKSGGRILGIEITPQVLLNADFKDLIIRAKWDNEAVPAINCPLGDFFGYGFGKPAMQSMLVGVKEGVHYCYLPMPFDSKALLELEFLKNKLNKTTAIPLTVTVVYADEKRAGDEGKFYAEWKRNKHVEQGQPYLILDKKGRGHYVGTALQAQGLNSGMTLFFEGDDVCVVDGEMRFHGTGSEDYFNGGWYALPDRWDQAFSLPTHGCLAYSVPLAHTGGYRFLLSDKISFEKSIHLTIEHGGENNSVPGDYTSVAYYYCDAAPLANKLPEEELLRKIESPKLQEYWLALLPINALGKGATVSYEDCKDSKTGRNYEVFRLVAGDDGFAKFELEVPENGTYKLYLSYFKTPDGGPFELNQRQIPIKKMNGFAPENTFVDKEYVGQMDIREGTNTITLMLKKDSRKKDSHTALIHRVYLERLN